MPKIGKRHIAVDGRLYDIFLHYGTKDGFYFKFPVEIEPMIDSILENYGNYSRGSEKEALKTLQVLIDKYHEDTKNLVKVIYIQSAFGRKMSLKPEGINGGFSVLNDYLKLDHGIALGYEELLMETKAGKKRFFSINSEGKPLRQVNWNMATQDKGRYIPYSNEAIEFLDQMILSIDLVAIKMRDFFLAPDLGDKISSGDAANLLPLPDQSNQNEQ